MSCVIAQLSDIHIGGPSAGSGERFSEALAEINAMARQPDLVLVTGDNTHNNTEAEWQEFSQRLEALSAPWIAINGNHDPGHEATGGHKALQQGPLRLVLLDSSAEVFTDQDQTWLDEELSTHSELPTVIAIHHPPFETGIWWMDCVGLRDAEKFEEVVRRHPQVIKVLSGHAHRVIQTNWDGCSLWVCPSTSVAVAGDIHPEHEPAETAEPPSFSLHTYTGKGIVSHVIPVGPTAVRTPIANVAPEFVTWARSIQAKRSSLFT